MASIDIGNKINEICSNLSDYVSDMKSVFDENAEDSMSIVKEIYDGQIVPGINELKGVLENTENSICVAISVELKSFDKDNISEDKINAIKDMLFGVLSEDSVLGLALDTVDKAIEGCHLNNDVDDIVNTVNSMIDEIKSVDFGEIFKNIDTSIFDDVKDKISANMNELSDDQKIRLCESGTLKDKVTFERDENGNIDPSSIKIESIMDYNKDGSFTDRFGVSFNGEVSKSVDVDLDTLREDIGNFCKTINDIFSDSKGYPFEDGHPVMDEYDRESLADAIIKDYYGLDTNNDDKAALERYGKLLQFLSGVEVADKDKIKDVINDAIDKATADEDKDSKDSADKKEGGFEKATHEFESAPNNGTDSDNKRAKAVENVEAHKHGKSIIWEKTGNESIDKKIEKRNAYIENSSFIPTYSKKIGYTYTNMKILFEARRNNVEINGKVPSASDCFMAFYQFTQTNVFEGAILFLIDLIADGITGEKEDKVDKEMTKEEKIDADKNVQREKDNTDKEFSSNKVSVAIEKMVQKYDSILKVPENKRTMEQRQDLTRISKEFNGVVKGILKAFGSIEGPKIVREAVATSYKEHLVGKYDAKTLGMVAHAIENIRSFNVDGEKIKVDFNNIFSFKDDKADNEKKDSTDKDEKDSADKEFDDKVSDDKDDSADKNEDDKADNEKKNSTDKNENNDTKDSDKEVDNEENKEDSNDKDDVDSNKTDKGEKDSADKESNDKSSDDKKDSADKNTDDKADNDNKDSVDKESNDKADNGKKDSISKNTDDKTSNERKDSADKNADSKVSNDKKDSIDKNTDKKNSKDVSNDSKPSLSLTKEESALKKALSSAVDKRVSVNTIRNNVDIKKAIGTIEKVDGRQNVSDPVSKALASLKADKDIDRDKFKNLCKGLEKIDKADGVSVKIRGLISKVDNIEKNNDIEKNNIEKDNEDKKDVIAADDVDAKIDSDNKDLDNRDNGLDNKDFDQKENDLDSKEDDQKEIELDKEDEHSDIDNNVEDNVSDEDNRPVDDENDSPDNIDQPDIKNPINESADNENPDEIPQDDAQQDDTQDIHDDVNDDKRNSADIDSSLEGSQMNVINDAVENDDIDDDDLDEEGLGIAEDDRNETDDEGIERIDEPEQSDVNDIDTVTLEDINDEEQTDNGSAVINDESVDASAEETNPVDDSDFEGANASADNIDEQNNEVTETIVDAIAAYIDEPENDFSDFLDTPVVIDGEETTIGEAYENGQISDDDLADGFIEYTSDNFDDIISNDDILNSYEDFMDNMTDLTGSDYVDAVNDAMNVSDDVSNMLDSMYEKMLDESPDTPLESDFDEGISMDSLDTIESSVLEDTVDSDSISDSVESLLQDISIDDTSNDISNDTSTNDIDNNTITNDVINSNDAASNDFTMDALSNNDNNFNQADTSNDLNTTNDMSYDAISDLDTNLNNNDWNNFSNFDNDDDYEW